MQGGRWGPDGADTRSLAEAVLSAAVATFDAFATLSLERLTFAQGKLANACRAGSRLNPRPSCGTRHVKSPRASLAKEPPAAVSVFSSRHCEEVDEGLLGVRVLEAIDRHPLLGPVVR
jgi:hypothetical protein